MLGAAVIRRNGTYLTPLLSTLLLLFTGQPLTTARLVGAILILVCSTGVLINERIHHDTRPMLVKSPPRPSAPNLPTASERLDLDGVKEGEQRP